MTKVEPDILREVDEQRPRFAVGLLSRQEKDMLIERGMVGLYRWYLSRSQATRNWNPDKDFDWRAFRTDHSPALNTIIEGFFAVEQYVPDYVSTLLRVIRRSHGRSHFHIRWGAEEEKHADTWLNTLLFSRWRAPQWIEDYKHALRSQEWRLPWDDALHMVFYTVIQERATQLNYLNTVLIARGQSDHPDYAHDADPVLEKVAHTIAVDEAAHYNFFLECARLMLYYYPAQALAALQDVINHFAMPAGDIIPNYDAFAETALRTGVYSSRQYMRDVLQIALKNLSLSGRQALARGIKQSRLAPDADGNLQQTAIFEGFNYDAVEAAVQRLYGRIAKYEAEIGFSEIHPTQFVASGLKIAA